MTTEPASSLRRGGYVTLNDMSCKITGVEPAGEGRLKVTGTGLQSGQEQSAEFDEGEDVPVPIVTRTDYQLTDINADDGNLATLMDPENGDIVDDLRVPGDPAYQPLVDGYGGAGERNVFVTVMSDQKARWILPQFLLK
ncbi:hypothetical protein DFJ74DRAFT_75039 [Hyaloraphidium curvatum]|nr:hypothetical protein DFJ74DRAFT_75039 [Hyaloraphidium curvatum]